MRSETDVDARPEDRCVHYLALEAEDLGFEVEWLSRTTGAAADDAVGDGSLDGTISGATATTGYDGSGALAFDGTDD